MSDFFEGLAARSSGAATALRPRPASTYETQDAAEVVEEVPAAGTPFVKRAVSVAPERPSVAEPAERVVLRDVVSTRTETSEAAPPIFRDDRLEQRVERVRERTHERTHHQETIETVRELLATPLMPEGRAEALPGSRLVQEPAERRAEALPPRRPQPPAIPRQRTTADRQPITIRQPVANRQPANDPVVRITIGRVEVRAVQPAQPAPRPVPPPAAQGPTLAEFLEERERRK